MQNLSDDLLQQLLDLIDRLRDESAGFQDQPGDQQLWYNRGYANGMVQALAELGAGARLEGRQPDDSEVLAPHLPMPWGKAYRHGEQMGQRETHEITGKSSE
jgi:hypothetical protein